MFTIYIMFSFISFELKTINECNLVPTKIAVVFLFFVHNTLLVM